MVFNPTLVATAQPTSTPSDAVLAYEVDRSIAPTSLDYPRLYQMLIVANTVLWIAYLLGMLK